MVELDPIQNGSINFVYFEMDTVLTRLANIDFPRPCLARVYPPADEKLLVDPTLDRKAVEKEQLDLCFRDLSDFILEPYQYSKPWKTMNRFSAKNTPKDLGLVGITDKMFDFSNVNWYYSYLAKAKARRHDQDQSTYEIWQTEKPNLLERACLSYQAYHPEENLLAQPIQVIEDECFLRLRQLGGPGLFPSLLAVGFFKKFKATKVLDLAAGWGCRLTAACAAHVEYVGADPNTELIEPHQSIIKQWGDSTKHKVIAQPFEDIKWDPKEYGTFDMLFSSPPFFNLEVYSDEKTQCSERYPTLDKWLQEFLYPSFRTADKLLKPGAIIVVHLNDVIVFGRPQDNVPVCQKFIMFCTMKLGWKVLGQYGFSNRKDFSEREESDQPKVDRAVFADKRRKVVRKTFDQDGFRVDREGVVLAQPLFILVKPKK